MLPPIAACLSGRLVPAARGAGGTAFGIGAVNLSASQENAVDAIAWMSCCPPVRGMVAAFGHFGLKCRELSISKICKVQELVR